MSELLDTELRLILDDYWPPNVNRTGGHHWKRLHTEKHRAFNHVTAAYLDTSPRVQFEGPVRVTIVREWGHRQRAMDKDNLYGAAKFVLDALREDNQAEQRRRLGIIGDDDPDSITLNVLQRAGEKGENGRRRLRTLITIEGKARDVVPA